MQVFFHAIIIKEKIKSTDTFTIILNKLAQTQNTTRCQSTLETQMGRPALHIYCSIKMKSNNELILII